MRDEILKQIADERSRQDQKWGEQNYPHTYFLGILMEEVGEVAKAAIEFNHDQYRAELIHTAAVAVLMLEAFDRKAWRQKAVAELPE